MDINKSGRIDYTEFIAATLDEKTNLKEQRLYEEFKNFDKDGSGKITSVELMKILKLEDNDPESEKKLKRLLKKLIKMETIKLIIMNF